jgi:hypothetical protein
MQIGECKWEDGTIQATKGLTQVLHSVNLSIAIDNDSNSRGRQTTQAIYV